MVYVMIFGVAGSIAGLAVLGHHRIRRQLELIRATRRDVEQLMQVLDERARTLEGRCQCGYLHNVRGAGKRLRTMSAQLGREEATWE